MFRRRSQHGTASGHGARRDRRLTPCVYILASARNGTLYIGVTSDLIARVYQHRSKAEDGFTKTYNVMHLVWYEQHATMEYAIGREKRLKEWPRRWKLEMIEDLNPTWRDLYEDLVT